MAERVLLHVGAPKTGTSFVQDILFQHRETLRSRGILYPADRFDAHFLAALDLMQLPWGGLEHEAVGAWDKLAAEVRAWRGTAIISHEILGTASRLQVARAITSLSDPSGETEIHLIFSARDLVRQIPAEWQENVKHRRTATYAGFISSITDPERATPLGRWFWGVQEVPDVLDRWGSTLPRERVHLVTVPPSGAPRDLLWKRFAGLFGIDAKEFHPTTDRTNSSLGVAEATLIRRLNVAIQDVVQNHNYRPLVREFLVHRNLSGIPDATRLSVPPETWKWAADLSRLWVAELAMRGYDVVGDLDELLPAEPPIPFVNPDQPDEATVADAGVRALAAMVQETARLRESEIRLEARVEELSGQLGLARGTRIYRTKERIVRKASSSAVGRVGLKIYRRMRGRNSRSA
jgi:hypothetical protein